MTATQNNVKVGLSALLTPDNCAVILISSSLQFTGLSSHDGHAIINNVAGLAKLVRVLKVPTLFTTIIEQQGGYLIKPLQEVFPEQVQINKKSFHN